MYNKINPAVSTDLDARRPSPFLTSKDQQYLRMLEEKQGSRGQIGSRDTQQVQASRARENPEHNYNKGVNGSQGMELGYSNYSQVESSPKPSKLNFRMESH